MTAEFVGLERSGALARIMLRRPPLNILNIPMLRELSAAVGEVALDGSAKVLLLGGEGRAFSAGVDVADHTAERVGDMLAAFHSAVRALLDLEIPVVGVVQGAALGGGCELLLACDVVLAREDARLGQPEIKLGTFPPVAAAALARRVGPQRAADLVLTGRVVGAREAERMGLVLQALPAAGFEAAVEQYAASLLELSGPVLRLTKRALRESLELPLTQALRSAERLYLDELMRLGDAREGVAAFMEKRAPVWREA